MSDLPRLDLVHKAICLGVLGHVEWKDAAVKRLANDPEMGNFSTRGVRLLLREFVQKGGQLDTRKQGLELWEKDSPHWYRAVIPVPEFPKGLFVELILSDDEQEPWVQIVSAHRQL